MKTPPPSEAARCLELRKQAKRGMRLHPDDQSFVEQMYRKYSGWYSSTEREIFIETAPFGSRIGELKRELEENS